jgi:hypothetical protein
MHPIVSLIREHAAKSASQIENLLTMARMIEASRIIRIERPDNSDWRLAHESDVTKD